MCLQTRIIRIVKTEHRHSSLHQRSRSTHRQKVMNLLDAFHNRFSRKHIAQTPARNRVSLAQAATFNRALKHSRERRNVRMAMRSVNDMLVNFVRNHIQVVLDCKRCNNRKFFVRKDFTARICRIAKHQRLHARLRHRTFQDVRIKAQVNRRKRHINRSRPAKNRIRRIVLVKRREQNHLIAQIADRHHRSHHRFSTAASNHNFFLRIVTQPAKMELLVAQRLAEILCAKSNRILVRTRQSHFRKTLRKRLRRVKIRESLRQVNSPARIGNTGHSADNGISKSFGAFT